MVEPVLITKIMPPPPPPRARLVERARLTERLDPDGDAPPRLALVVAPPGFGKSTLLAGWLRDRPGDAGPVAWLTLDAADNDPARFLLHVGAALERALPGFIRVPPAPSPRAALVPLLNAVAAHPAAAAAVTLVLDDYHVLDAPPVHEAVAFLLDHLPPNLRLVIATRVDPPLPLSRLRARGQLSELRAADLRFTNHEAAAFLNGVMGLDLPSETVERLEARTEGWAAGLQLAALSLQGRPDPSRFLDGFTGSNRFVVDYLADEVLERQPEAVQEFLLRTAPLERLCGPLCDAVTGCRDGQAMLERLEKANLFLIPLDETRRWWRYHHLFADVLRARLKQRLAASETAALHARAAAWWESEGFPDEAVRHAAAAGDTGRVARIVAAHGEALWARGETRTLARWIAALPEPRRRADARLAIAEALVELAAGRLQAMESPLRDAENALERTGDDDDAGEEERADLRGRIATLRCFIVRNRGDLDGALRLAREALDCLTDAALPWRAVAAANLASVHWWQGDREQAFHAYGEAAATSRRAGDVSQEVTLRCMQAIMRREQGRFGDAGRLYRDARRRAEENGLARSPVTGAIEAGLGRLAWERDELDDAARHLQTAIERSRDGGNAQVFVEAVQLRAAVHLRRDERDAAAALLIEAEQAAQKTDVGVARHRAALFQARLRLLHESDLAAAADWERAYLRPPAARGDSGAIPAPRLPARDRTEAELLRARLALDRGDTNGARALLDGLTADTDAYRVEALILRALLHRRAGDGEPAQAALGEALLLAAPERQARPFLDAAPAVVPLLRHAAARGIATGFVAVLLDALRAAGPVGGAAVAGNDAPPGLADPLSERELEVLRLVAVGLSNPQIAGQLFLSVGTVKRHVYNIYRKLDATGRVDAVARARRLDLL